MYTSTNITGKKAKALIAKGATLIDTRSPVQFRDGTLPGAVNMSPRQVSALIKYPKNTKLVFFGDDQAAVDTFINYAKSMGFADVYTFGSIENWNT